MKIPWPLFLAWKQLFPSQRKVSFFSLLAVIGVALGVNVMIVVIAFMQGFQHKFRNDIIDAQGHGRVTHFNKQSAFQWVNKKKEIEGHPSILAVTPYLQGQLLLQRDDFYSIPFSMGIDPNSKNSVLSIDAFLNEGFLKMFVHDGKDITPIPKIDTLEDDVVFISTQVANRLGVRPSYVVRFDDKNSSKSLNSGTVKVSRLDPFVNSAEWEVIFKNEKDFIIKSEVLDTPLKANIDDGPIDLGMGFPVFEVVPGEKPFEGSEKFKFYVSAAGKIEVYAPSMIERATEDEMVPPREVMVGGIFEVPWQGFHTEALLGTIRFMQDMQSDDGRIDGFYFKAIDKVAQSESEIAITSRDLESKLGDGWRVIPWFVENAWFFDLLKFEEYLMILIMVPIGLVAAFAIAIALMTSVLRKIKEIGLLVAMGGGRASVGMVFCLQGFIIGFLGAVLGCGLALLFIHFRDGLMNFIVTKIAGEDGQAGVSQFYDFYSLEIYYPWESPETLNTFLAFAIFAIFVSTLAGLVPAWRATRLKPADSLRSE
tara:strand:- start:839 stop:2452 length:1614 start_codon:yes stop_codon:yes gene_type:complete